jgi:hypothetical protein
MVFALARNDITATPSAINITTSGNDVVTCIAAIMAFADRVIINIRVLIQSYCPLLLNGAYTPR